MNFHNVEFLISAAAPKDFPGNRLPEIAFAGKSNVGKSSVINRLLNRKNMARVGEKPGKTIHVNYFVIDKKCYLVDLPGYGYAKRTQTDKQKWSSLTDGYFTDNPNGDLLRLVIQLVDSRVGPTRDDEMMVDFLNQSGIPYAVVATKVDKLNKTEREKNLAAIASHPLLKLGTPIIPFSSLKGEGKQELWREIAELADMLGKAEPCEYVRIIGSGFWRLFCAMAVSPQAEKTKRDKKARIFPCFFILVKTSCLLPKRCFGCN